MNITQDVQNSLIDTPEYFRQHPMESVDALAQDILRNGQLQEIIITPKDGGRYELVAGKRRTLAMRHLNRETVRAQVMENLTDLQKALIMIAENEEREDVNPFDQALSYQRAVNAGATQRELATKLGVAEITVSHTLSLLGLSPEVTEDCRRRQLSGAHLQELVRLPNAESQLKMAKACDEAGWSSKVLRDKVSRALAGDAGKDAQGPAKAEVDVKPIRFSWKDGKLWVKAVYDPQGQTSFSEFTLDVDHAYQRFLELHPVPQQGVGMKQAA